ncbi:MAG: histidine kinase [Bacteroidota bacterium]
MTIKITDILPIVLAVVLPLLRVHTYQGNPVATGEENLWILWFNVALILYLLWYLLWFLWGIHWKSKKLWYVLVILCLQVPLMVVNAHWITANPDRMALSYLVQLLPPAILFTAIQFSLKSQENIAHLRLEKEQLQTENYKAQLKFLQAQIDPHFLFNSLNTLRSMVRQQHRGSEQFVLSLSNFYRQTLQYNETTSIELSKELKVLNAYLFLMKSRNEQAVKVDMQIEEALLDHQLPTLSLQLVVENCFKHNSLTSKSPLQINIKSTDKGYIKVCNNIQPRIGGGDSTGLGLEFIRKRYALMTETDGMIISQTETQFCVELKLLKP